MKNKIITTIILGIFLIGFSSALDLQNSIVCGGDSQLQIRCYDGDAQTSFFGFIPQIPHRIQQPTDYLFLILTGTFVFFISIFLFLILKRKNKQKQTQTTF
ncbi:MAG: hypothetical protein ACP6IY_09700 [Promethearchaeia archaeon]